MIESDFRSYVTNHLEGFNSIDFTNLATVVGELRALQESRSLLWTAGNGGSASTASHVANDFSKGLDPIGHKNIRTICLTDSIPTLTAWANDVAYSHAIAQQIETLAGANDVFFAISGSGNSQNIINAIVIAKKKGMKTISLTGFDGGKVANISDINVNVAINNMQVVEDIHLVLCHWMMLRLRSLEK